MDDGMEALVPLRVAAILDGGGNNIYNLVMQEITGRRRMVITIGMSEAQAIAVFMEGIAMPRPLTHDLMARLISAFGGRLSRVIIEGLEGGRFRTSLVMDKGGAPVILDSRTSDAVALAIRCQAPIFAREAVLRLANGDADALRSGAAGGVEGTPSGLLREKLRHAVAAEDYEAAQKIQDELRRRGEA